MHVYLKVVVSYSILFSKTIMLYFLYNALLLYIRLHVFQETVLPIWLVGSAVMSARFFWEVGQCLGMEGFIGECEAGWAEVAIALCVDLTHQHVVQPWNRKHSWVKKVRMHQIPEEASCLALTLHVKTNSFCKGFAAHDSIVKWQY